MGYLPQAMTIVPELLSLFQKRKGQHVVLESLKPGARIGTAQPGGRSVYGDDSTLPSWMWQLPEDQRQHLISTMNEAALYDPRQFGVAAQYSENERARNAARPYIQSIHDRGTTGRMQQLPGEVNALNEDVQGYYRDVRENPDIWTTEEMSAMASRYADQMAPALQGEMANIDATGARLGISPAAVEAMRTIARTGATQGQNAYRQNLTIQNAIASAGRADQANTLMGQIGGQLYGLEGTLQGSADAAANAADLLMASFEGTPENMMLPYELVYETNNADTLMKAGAYDDAAAYLASLADTGAGLWGGKIQQRAAQDAAAGGGLFESLLGPAAGAAGALGVASAPALFGMKWAFLCIDADTLVPTTRGSMPLKDVRVGDAVLTPRGYRKVIGRDVGTPHPDNNEWVAITTARGVLTLTTTHHIDGKPAGQYKEGEDLLTPDGWVKIHKIESVAPPPLAGDLDIEGCNEYCAGEIYVNSMWRFVK